MSLSKANSLLPLREWNLPIANMFLCAGPCSAESEEQLLQTAASLAGCPLSCFRAGIWKPRTRPGSFQGLGLTALPWLVRVREQFGFPIAAEVGTPAHVEAALRCGLDVLWIGARTTADPFAVQDLADALQGADVTVLVKNPVSPDLELWLGALERVQNAGIRQLGAVHRGFTTSVNTRYRNAPLWRISIELKRRLPELPLICDPSHLCGCRDLIFPTAQEALDLLYDGLMIEVHRNPSEAQSDREQQLTPAQYCEMLSRLVRRKEIGDSPSYETQMQGLRHTIDEVDEEIVEALARRMQIVRTMAELKRRYQVSTLQPTRWKEIIASRAAAARQRGLSDEFISQIYQLIHEEAIQLQEEPLFDGAERTDGKRQ
jgi:chorismate mutase